MPDEKGVFRTYTVVIPDFWLMACDNEASQSDTYCASKNSKDVNVAVKNREVLRSDWPTYKATIRRMFGNIF